MKHITKIFTALIILGNTMLVNPSTVAQTQDKQAPKISIAILLDASNSMDGLIDQARLQLWKIVNTLSKARKNNQVPQLEVALYQYGKSNLPGEEGYLQLLTGFTNNLDLVSEKLFSINTNGGSEYAGWVMRSAMQELNWTGDRQNFRVIFIAGNEPFDQGPVAYQEAIAEAVNQDVIVNTIYCGIVNNPEQNLWGQGARLGGGNTATIDHDRAIAVIPTPYDEPLRLLNEQLNATYIPYGEQGLEGQQRQMQEDMNAASRGVGSERGVSKVSVYYKNSIWDLVDALADETVKLEELETSALPSEMRSMSPQQRQDYIKKKRQQRQEIQAQIRQLSQQRESFIAKHNLDNQPRDTFDFAMIQMLKKQLAAKGFTLGN